MAVTSVGHPGSAEDWFHGRMSKSRPNQTHRPAQDILPGTNGFHLSGSPGVAASVFLGSGTSSGSQLKSFGNEECWLPEKARTWNTLDAAGTLGTSLNIGTAGRILGPSRFHVRGRFRVPKNQSYFLWIIRPFGGGSCE